MSVSGELYTSVTLPGGIIASGNVDYDVTPGRKGDRETPDDPADVEVVDFTIESVEVVRDGCSVHATDPDCWEYFARDECPYFDSVFGWIGRVALDAIQDDIGSYEYEILEDCVDNEEDTRW